MQPPGRRFDSAGTVRQPATVHRRRELESLEIHRRIARLLEEDPVRVIGKARGNLRSWLAQRGEDALCSTFREWEDLLDSLGVAELSRLLVAGDEKSVRLRQSSPFAGVLPPREVWEIKGSCSHTAA